MNTFVKYAAIVTVVLVGGAMLHEGFNNSVKEIAGSAVNNDAAPKILVLAGHANKDIEDINELNACTDKGFDMGSCLTIQQNRKFLETHPNFLKQ
jgi:hypothetical protein